METIRKVFFSIITSIRAVTIWHLDDVCRGQLLSKKTLNNLNRSADHHRKCLW